MRQYGVTGLLYEDSFGFFCATSDVRASAAKSGHLPASVFERLPLMAVPSIDCYGFALDQFLWRNKLQGRLLYKLDTFEVAREFAIEGVGIAVLPKIIVADAVGRNRLKELRVGEARRAFGRHEIGVFTRHQNAGDPLVELLRKELLAGFSASQ